MATPFWARMILELRGIPFEEVHHPEPEDVNGHRLAKAVVVIADGKPVSLVLPADRQANLGMVRGILGAEEARPASEEEMAQLFPECEPRAVAPLGHWDVPVLMDRSLYSEGDIVIHMGTHDDAIRLKFRDWYNVVRPRIAVFSEPLELEPT
jgi:Ala-tRNA(Pro) deacylase